MFALRRVLSVLCLVALVVLLPAAPLKPPDQEQIARWVKQLGDNDFDVREAATRKLSEAGAVAEAALEVAAKSDDAEVSRRAKDILEKFKWGVYPDTPKKVVELVEQYQAAEVNAKPEILRQLFDAGTPGCKVLLKIAKVETNPDLRANLITQIANELPRTVPLLLENNDFLVLERLVDIGLENQMRIGIPHYIAFWTLRDKLDDRIAHYQALEKKGDDAKRPAEMLAYLHRAKGDLKAALEAAQRANLDELVDHLLGEMGDWKRLAERKAEADPGDEIEKLSFRAAYYRLAGQKKELNETLAELKKKVEGAPGDDIRYLLVAKSLFLNARPEDALEVLSKGEHPLMIFEILCARNQFKEAFELVDKARFNGAKDVPVLEIAQARFLHLLGEKEKAAPLFAKYAALIKEGNEVSWYENLIEAEVKAGLTEAAFEHAAKVLSSSKDEGWRHRLFVKLYPTKNQAAAELWVMMRAMSAKEEPAATMKRLRAFLDGKTPIKEVTEFVDGIANLPASIVKSDGMADPRMMALAEVALAAKMEERALALFKQADGSAGWLRSGDVHADKKRWDKAAETYYKAWQAHRANPLPLWLSGWALKHAGKEAEGKKRMDQAHWLPLGNEGVRDTFAIDLIKRGHFEASRHETALIVKVGEPGSFDTGEATRRLALAAMARRDYQGAVEGHDKAMLRVMRSNTSFLQTSAYVGVPGSIMKLQAAALLKAGKTKEALETARSALEVLPGNVDIANILVPELEKRGQKKDADELFDKALKVHDRALRDYPNSSFAHNSIAWLRVCCNRDLDQALDHALKASKLAPAVPGHFDTLAEVYFQRGDQAKALAIQKKVVEMAPKRVYFRKQLKRIEAGDPKAARPVEEDDEDDDDD